MATPVLRTIVFPVGGAIARGDLDTLCARACESIERRGAELLLCDVGGVRADAVAVEALARLRLAARRRGCDVQMLRPSPQLRDLVAFMGLDDLIRADS